MEWEEIRTDRNKTLKRARVQRGWLVASAYADKVPGTLTFYFDPEHDWDGEVVELG